MTEEVITNRGWRIINTQQGMGGAETDLKREHRRGRKTKYRKHETKGLNMEDRRKLGKSLISKVDK